MTAIDMDSAPSQIPKQPSQKFRMGEHVWIENERKADGSHERRRYCIMAMKCDNEQSNSYRLKAVPKDDGKEHGWVGEHLLQLWPGE